MKAWILSQSSAGPAAAWARINGPVAARARFRAVGLAQLLLDWGVFVLAGACAVPVPAASSLCGRLAGALLGFWLNGR
jgi:putative flippase GtrA